MTTKYIRGIDFLFFIIILTLIFSNLPKPISLDVLGTTGKEFAIYPLCISTILTVYIWRISKKEGRLLDWGIDDTFNQDFTKVKWYISALLLFLILSVLLGVWSYPYYDQLLDNSEFLPARLAHAMELFHSDNISKGGIGLWLAVKGVKNIILDTLLVFGGAFLIYLWYRKRLTRCFDLFIKGIFISLGIIFLYELIELPYLLGSQKATSILATINPYIHQIGYLNNYYIANTNAEVQAYAWWPPLLWKHQVRSVFPEPSFFGLYCAFAIPWLWYVLFRIRDGYLASLKCIAVAAVILFFDFLVFATQARTAVLLFLGESALLIFYGFYQRRNVRKRILSIILLAVIAFVGSLFFFQAEKDSFAIDEGYIVEDGTESFLQKAGESYVSENIASAVGKSQRSNRARFSLMEAELRVWTDYPLLGVGKGLKGAYIPDKLPSDAIESSEVRMWLDRLHSNGALKASFLMYLNIHLSFVRLVF